MMVQRESCMRGLHPSTPLSPQHTLPPLAPLSPQHTLPSLSPTIPTAHTPTPQPTHHALPSSFHTVNLSCVSESVSSFNSNSFLRSSSEKCLSTSSSLSTTQLLSAFLCACLWKIFSSIVPVYMKKRGEERRGEERRGVERRGEEMRGEGTGDGHMY